MGKITCNDSYYLQPICMKWLDWTASRSMQDQLYRLILRPIYAQMFRSFMSNMATPHPSAVNPHFPTLVPSGKGHLDPAQCSIVIMGDVHI